MRAGLCAVLILLVAGCASTPPSNSTAPADDTSEATSTGSPASTAAPSATAAKPVKEKPAVVGLVDVDVSDVNGRSLPARLELQPAEEGGQELFEIPTGVQTIEPGVGNYYAFVYVYDEGVPMMVHAQELVVSEGETAYVLVNLLEGASGKLSVHDYDQDGDLAIDKVEVVVGTDPENPSSIPGRWQINYDERVFANEDRWYRGELHAVSTYGGGKETVAELVRRAESAGLDFLAITDLNTMESINDPAFRSDSVVLIPAMAWGSVEQGIGLVYGPATVPDLPTTREAAQAECVRIQSQGGVFAIAHPCFPDKAWRWGLSFVNAVQVWNGPWREAPPMHLSDLTEAEKIREPGTGELIRSIAAAAALTDKTQRAAAIAKRKDVSVSANDQAMRFWDYELSRGAVSSLIAGGMVDGPNVPMGKPVTWVKAPNKSIQGILQGLRKGRTFVSSEIDGVEIDFQGDVMNDGSLDINVGGAVSVGIETRFVVTIFKGEGARIQFIRDGHQLITQNIESNHQTFYFTQTSDFPCTYRVRVVRQPRDPGKGYGPVEVLAMSSPIYAADIGADWVNNDSLFVDKAGIHLNSEFVPDDPRVRGY